MSELKSHPRFLEPLEYLDTCTICAHRAEYSRFSVNVERIHECTHIAHVNVCLSLKQARNRKKTVPWRGFYSSSVGPAEHFVCCPFGLIIVLWDRHDSPSVYSQTAAANGERKNEVGRGGAVSPVQVREPPQRYCSFTEAKGRWKIWGSEFQNLPNP